VPIANAILCALLILGCLSSASQVMGQTAPVQAPGPGSGTGTGAAKPGGVPPKSDGALDLVVRELAELSQAQEKANAAEGPEINRLKSKLEFQQRQIEVLLKMTQLLAEQAKKQPESGAAVEKLEEQVATQESRIEQGARRDQELASSRDDLAEVLDASSRAQPALPSTLRELFLPMRTNESPLSIYGQLTQEFNTFSQQNSTFRPPTLQLHPYLLLNERWLMSANMIFLSSSLVICRMQAEYFLNDNWTVVAGRFYSPVGFFSERLRLEWVIKTADNPLLFNQVYPNQLYFDGVQFRGSRYLFESPVKLEYVGFVANGLSVPGAKLSQRTYSDLSNFTDSTVDVNGAKAFGGRIGVSIPRYGFIAGVSGLANQDYDQAGHILNMWDVDVNYHKGNWDARFELVKTDQSTPSFPIHRFGFYAQVAYRQYDNPNPILQKLEGVFRFDHIQLDGINVAQTGLNFGGFDNTYARVPLDRNRYTFGLNYWFYPSLALKADFEIYDELGVPSLRDNGFICQLVWGF
jgi:hypothetical protein